MAIIVAAAEALSGLTALPATAAAHATDPSQGPNTVFDLAHAHDALRFTPSTGSTIPRRSTVPNASAASGSAAVAGGGLSKEVLGFAPYWELSQQASWRYSLLSTVAYFGLDLQTDGNFNLSTPGGQGWGSAQLTTIVNNAHQAGDRVVVVLKANSTSNCNSACTVNALVTNETARQAAVANTINAIALRGLDGVNVDLEGTSTGYPSVQAGFTTFIQELSSAVHQRWPLAYVTVDTYSGSASWDGGIYKIGDLAPLVDGIFVMAYDMYSANMQPGQAGPNAPLAGPWQYTDTLSVNQYLGKAPASKILLGVPYYGYKWSTTSVQPYATATSGAEADTYAGVSSDFSCAQSLGKNWDTQASSPWATWWSPPSGDPCGGNHNSWRELYYDNAQSIGLKYDLVNASGIAGTGMWALGFDGSSSDLWDVIANKFTGAAATFYFGEGFTGSGFNESLDLLMPGIGGTAYIDYYTEQGHLPTFGIALAPGKVTAVNVNQYVGSGHSVSAVVHFPAPGIAERVMHFGGSWHGSTAIVGSTSPAGEWDFAEGSTLPAFSEFLSLQNPSTSPAPVTLNYFTDTSAHPSRSLTLPANSRTTVQVFSGDASLASGSCTVSGGQAINCGVGRGISGVSTQVLSPSVPIVVERPMYVNGFNFGDGPIWDGHDAFGANAPATSWNFAEGTTLAGFKEYLTLQNPQTSDAAVTLKYVDTSGNATSRSVTVKAQSRATVQVFDATNGVGPQVGGVSAQVSSSIPIVAERPMYVYHNFGSGVVGGAHDVLGATTTGKTFEFSAASTAAGENDYLTIENPNSEAADLVISYLGPASRTSRVITVGANSRHTVEVFNGAEGAGRGISPLGIVVGSDQPIVVEAPTYSSNPGSYGATDTLGYTPPAS